MPQGLAALLAFKPEATLLENMDSITEQLGKIKSTAIITKQSVIVFKKVSALKRVCFWA